MIFSKFLPKWFLNLIPNIGYERLSRQEVLDLGLDRFKKWEGFYVGWPVEEGNVIEKGRLLWVRHFVDKQEPPTNPPLAPA